MAQDWYQAKAEIRVTEVTFKFKDTVFEVRGMIDLIGPTGSSDLADEIANADVIQWGYQ